LGERSETKNKPKKPKNKTKHAGTVSILVSYPQFEQVIPKSKKSPRKIAGAFVGPETEFRPSVFGDSRKQPIRLLAILSAVRSDLLSRPIISVSIFAGLIAQFWASFSALDRKNC